MSTIDIVILLFIAAGTWKCWRGGLTRSVWGVAAIFTGVWAASHFWREVASNLERLIANPELSKWVSVIGIAAAVSMATDWLLERIQNIFDKGVLGWINGLAGAVFGVFVGVFLTGSICILVVKYGSESIKNTVQQSQLAELAITFTRQFLDFSKEALQQQVEKMRHP